MIGEKFQRVNWASLHKGPLENTPTVFFYFEVGFFFRASVESIENASILSGSAIEDYPRISPSLLKQILTNMKQSDSTWKINSQPNVESSLPSKSSNYYKINTDQPEKESFKVRKMSDHVKTKVEQTTNNNPNESEESNDFKPADQEQLIHIKNTTNTPGTRFKK